MCATASGHVQAAAALLQAGADINAGLADPRYPDGATPLLWAIRARNPQCASLLMENGAAVNSPQAYSEAPIHGTLQAFFFLNHLSNASLLSLF